MTDSDAAPPFDTEYQTFGKYDGRTLMYRSRYSGSTRTSLQVFTFSSDATGKLWSQMQSLDPTVSGYDPTTVGGIDANAPPSAADVQSTSAIDPPFLRMAKSMTIGHSWGSGSVVTVNFATGLPSTVGATQMSTLLGVEDVTLPDVSVSGAIPVSITYSGCLKITDQRAAVNLGGASQRISWYCPGGVGLVKRIVAIINTGSSTTVRTRIFELKSIQ